jgi:hypothetical protein
MVGKRSFARRRAGVQFVVNAMLETADFFEAQIKQCRDSAAQSTNKNDREFWLKMAARWEGLSKARQNGDQPVRRPTGLSRSMFRRSMLLARQALCDGGPGLLRVAL